MTDDRVSSAFSELSQWIWLPDADESPNQYVQFRQEFELSGGCSDACVRISCDSNYALWVNGEFIDYGQYHDYPDNKVYDELPMPKLKAGRNVLAILAYYQGETSFQYLKGAPGLIYEITCGDEVISSSTEAICRIDPGYTCGRMDRITPQLGFVFEYDARGADDWQMPDYQLDRSWRSAAVAQSRLVAKSRPISKLRIGSRLKTKIAAQGLFARKTENSLIAQTMKMDYLSTRDQSQVLTLLEDGGYRVKPAEGADGTYIVLDVGREEAGLLDLDIEAPAGTQIDIAWGEHLDELRVHSRIGPRNFACRYTCGEGRRLFIHYFTRLAGRYLQLHILNPSAEVAVHYAGLTPVEYPVEVRGAFKCPDSLHNMIYETSVRTLHLCMHEHYEDCPWREQALYAMDMRNQALAGYYCFGNYDFAAASLELLADGLKDDGYLEMCAPAEIAITIPSFTLAWVLSVADHLLYSGDLAVAKRLCPAVKSILDSRSASAGSGLLPCPTGPRYWHFYEWAPGLDGCNQEGCTGFAVVSRTRYDAALNLFYALALESGAKIADAVGDVESKAAYAKQLESLRPQIHATFWDESDGVYVSGADGPAKEHKCDLVQALALLAGVCDGETADRLRARLASEDSGLVKATLSHSMYKFEALMTDADRYAPFVFDTIARDWGYMLRNGATSFWETILGSADFSNAGSLCHGWSGIPAYFYHAYVLGVKPTAPGFAQYSRKPIDTVIGPGTGVVPTPSGDLQVP